MAWLELECISVSFDTRQILRNISLALDEGDLLALLGPSGSGKTSLLRAVAGLVTLKQGRIILDQKDISSLPPQQRNIGMVFQSYALFPHLSLRDNISFGLDVRGGARQEIVHRVAEIMELTDLVGLEKRFPHELSGGQQQRGALARALLPGPRLLLLDEPFAALDKNLRDQMREELKKIQRKTGVTMIFVTHDQGEALQLADKVAVMKEGKIVQFGLPVDIYRAPQDRFVAEFVGEANFFEGEFLGIRGGGTVMVRPENMELAAAQRLPWHYEGDVLSCRIIGPRAFVRLNVKGKEVLAYCHPELAASLAQEKKISIGWKEKAMIHLTEGQS